MFAQVALGQQPKQTQTSFLCAGRECVSQFRVDTLISLTVRPTLSVT